MGELLLICIAISVIAFISGHPTYSIAAALWAILLVQADRK